LSAKEKGREMWRRTGRLGGGGMSSPSFFRVRML
jgi:hypothetical protein